MRNEKIINEAELRKTILQLKPDGKLFEVRVIGGRKPLSGYFRDADTLIRAFDTVDFRGCNAYITLHTPVDAVGAREQMNCFRVVKQTTSDDEIKGYDWLFIDLDPERPTGISSNADELKAAGDLAQKIYVYMKGLGFEEPIKACSGNGYHLLYGIALANNEENRKLVERCLKALSMMFSTNAVKVDTTNFNPSRICKLYGTMAQKGSDTSDRPHRMSMIYGDIRQVKTTGKAYLEKLAADIPQEEVKPARYNRYAPNGFDIEDWMSEHGISYRVKSDSDSVKYILDHCPFDGNHKAPDSMIFKMPTGAIGFKCLHNSCQGKTWQDVRTMFEPDAYMRDDDFERSIEEGWKRHNRDKKPEEVAVDNGKRWETAMDILSKPTPDNEFVKTHIGVIDAKTHGLLKSGISLWSGLRGASKSTILSQIALQVANDNHTVLFYSGEMTGKRVMRWMFQQAAGKQYMQFREGESGDAYYYVPNGIQNKIAGWLGNRLFVYNNGYGSGYENLMNSLENQIKESKPDLIVLDNLMTIDLNEVDSNEYKAQTVVMLKIKELATKYNVHIALVAHPRKAISFLRLMDVSGSANIQNLIDQAFIVHRVNHDFRRAYLEEFLPRGAKEEEVALFNATNVIEVAKDRETGLIDEFISLWYEPESRRVKNSPTEVIKFMWTTEWEEEEANDGFMPVTDDSDLPFD